MEMKDKESDFTRDLSKGLSALWDFKKPAAQLGLFFFFPSPVQKT